MAEETMVEEAKEESTKEALRCSFCHKTQYAVRYLIASPPSKVHPKAYICDQCVVVCNTILWDKLDKL